MRQYQIYLENLVLKRLFIRYYIMQQLINGEEIVSNYMKERLARDSKSQQYMDNVTLRVIFDILTKFSYALFSLDALIIYQNGNFQHYKDYFQHVGTKSILFFAIIIGVLIFVTLRQVKQSNDIPPQSKKILNFAVDVMRVCFYILILIFIAPLLLDNYSNGFWEAGAFYTFCIAVALFVARKTIKWIYYLGQGKAELGPWKTDANTKKQQSLKQMANFMHFYLKNHKIPVDLIQESKPSNVKPNQANISNAKKEQKLEQAPIDWGS